MAKLRWGSSTAPLGPTATVLSGWKKKKSHPFLSCAGETSKGRAQFKQGLWYSFCCCGSGDFGCEEVWSLIDGTWLAKASSIDTVAPAKPVLFGCGARWGWSRFHWWNLSFSNILCIPIRSASAVQLSQPSTYKTEMALLRRLQKGTFWYTKCFVRVMSIFFLFNFPSLLLKGFCFKSRLSR